MAKQPEHYKILQYVVCDVIDGLCQESCDMNHKLTPDCTSCEEYQGWKKSGLTISEYLKKLHEDYLDESMPGRRDNK